MYAIGAAQHATALRSLILYEPPLRLGDEMVTTMHAELTAALDAGGPDLAIERFFPYAGVTVADAALVRSEPEVWEQLRDGVHVLPQEPQAMRDQPVDHASSEAPNVPTLYLYGEDTQSPSFLAAAEVAEIFPQAEIRALPGQRHLAPVFDPDGFAAQVLEFTAIVDNAWPGAARQQSP